MRPTRDIRLLPRHLLPRLLALHTRHSLKPLTQLHGTIPSRRQRKILSQTHAWPAIKRQKLKPLFPLDETLRLEIVGVLAPDGLAPVEDVDAVGDVGALGDEDGRLAAGAAAAGKGGVVDGVAGVEGDDGVEAEGFVEAGLEVGVGFELGEGDVRGVGAEVVENTLS